MTQNLHDRLEKALHGSGQSPAEIHGELTALHAAGALQADAWLDRQPEEAKDALGALVQQTNLDDPECGFQPLLPEDGEPLAKRIAALAAWAGSFLSTLGTLKIDPAQVQDDDVRQFVIDMAAIAQAQRYKQDHPQAEASYAELVEYVRAGSMLLRAHVLSEGGAGKP